MSGPLALELDMENQWKDTPQPKTSYYKRELCHLVPSEGDKPPLESLLLELAPQHRFKPKPALLPTEVLLDDLVLPEDWTMEERWNHLNFQEGLDWRPDYTATEMAVHGITLDFKSISPPLAHWRTGSVIHPDAIPADAKTSPKQIPYLKPFVQVWLVQDVVTDNIQQIPEDAHFSRLFHVPKDKDKIRPIIDLSLMNKFVVSPSFRMEDLKKATKGIQDPSWGAKLDIQDAFLSVSISPRFQKYFVFWIEHRAYMFKRMPFGLTTAPWVFTRLMRAVKRFLRRKGVRVNSFIDDFLIWARSKERAALHLEWTKRVLVWLGFRINIKKTSTTPSQQITYLGVDLDLQNLTMSLPPAKVSHLVSLSFSTTQRQFVSRADLESLIGLVIFSYSVLPIGRMYATPLIVWMNTHTSALARFVRVPVTHSLREMLSPFCTYKFLSRKRSFKRLIPDLTVMTDASDYGWSGVILPYCVKDIWCAEDRSRHINEKEMLAIHYFAQFMSPCLAGKHVVIHTDSEVVFFCLKRMGSLRSPALMSLVREFLSLCLAQDITFEVRHIPGKLNVLADSGSRDTLSVTENCLDQETFSFGSYLAGLDLEVAVDLCATWANTKCKHYVSPGPDPSPECVGVDVTRVDWSNFAQIYLFPPMTLLEDLLPKIEKFQGRALIIAPPTGLALPILESKARIRMRLPDSSFLFQTLPSGQVVIRNMFYDLWMWVW